jgi:hypothetical protein
MTLVEHHQCHPPVILRCVAGKGFEKAGCEISMGYIDSHMRVSLEEFAEGARYQWEQSLNC